MSTATRKLTKTRKLRDPAFSGTSPGLTGSKKYLSPDELFGALKALREEVGGQNLVIIGGIAMQHYGSDRLTGDLDLLAKTVPAMVSFYSKKPKKLTFGGVRFRVGGVPVDILVRDDELQKLYQNAYKEGMKSPLKMVSMEHLTVMKMAAPRLKDKTDLAFLLAHPKLDYEKTRKLAVLYLGWYAGQELDSFRAEAEWRKKAGI
jgi:hypothetical protein